jgi:hypothetical protein
MGQIQSMFDELSSLTIQAGLAKAVKLHERLVRFRERLPEEFDDFENAYGHGPIDLDTPHGEKMVVRFTMCGIYLQLKMLVLLPLLELAVWRSARFEPLAYSDQLIDLAHECVMAGTQMVRILLQHDIWRSNIHFYISIPETGQRVSSLLDFASALIRGQSSLSFVRADSLIHLPACDYSLASRPYSCYMPSQYYIWTCSDCRWRMPLPRT